MLNCTKYKPSEHLSRYVVHYWVTTGTSDAELFVIPDSYPELLFSFDGKFSAQIEDSDFSGIRAGVFGQFSRSCVLRTRTGSQTLMVKLFPWTPSLLFDTPLYYLNDRVTEAGELADSGFLRLAKRVNESDDVEAAINHIELFLLQRIYGGRQERMLLTSLVQEIFRLKGRVSIEELANQHGIGMRYLQQLFRDQVGLSPAFYRKQIRVKNMSLELVRKNIGGLSNFANDWGYSDLSHLIKDFKSIVRLSPSQYRKRVLKRDLSLLDFALDSDE